MAEEVTGPATVAVRPADRHWERPSARVLLALVFAAVQITLAGYELGVGNQSIQVPFLLRLHNPELFSRDLMVNTTLAAYPSLFYRLLAPLLHFVSLPALYRGLHFLTTAGVFFAVLTLSRAMFRSVVPGCLAALMLVAGHHRALAEQNLYSTGFTHTWAVLPLTLTALAFLYADRPGPAFALAGLSFNLHAIEAGQLALVITAYALGHLKPRRVAGLLTLFVLLASPTLLQMLLQRQVFDADWLQLMRLRSGHHSFPSTWWRPGQPDLPRFALVLALAAVSLTLLPGPHLRKTLWLTGAVAGLFLCGVLFTEVWPVPLAVRAQLFRASRFLMILALLVIAAGCWRARGIERLGAALTLGCLAAPPWLSLLPASVVVVTLLALYRGRLLWTQAVVAGAAMLITVASWKTLDFVPIGFSMQFHRPPPGVEADWVDVQRWARANTPTNALFLTPAQQHGFRVHSQRAIVGEWRDGTQLFFSAAFARPWWQRMEALQPGLRIAPDARRLLVQGRSLSQLDDATLLDLAARFDADYIVVAADPPRRLVPTYHNRQWAIYRPEWAPEPVAEKTDVTRFLADVAWPNIEKYRRSDVRLQLLDAEGRPLYDAPYRIRQTTHQFLFLGPRYQVLTNAWRDLEPAEGDRRLDALEAARQEPVTWELAVVTGNPPAWVRVKPEPEQARHARRHLFDLLDRFGDRIRYWQLTDQGLYADQLTNWVAGIRAKYPQAKLGIRIAPRLDGSRPLPALEEVRAGLDFVALDARKPRGIRADARQLYEALDAYAQAGARIHISRFEAPTSGWIEGRGESGQWTPELAAEYYRQFLTIAFSHPAVDAIAASGDEWLTTLEGKVALDGVIQFRGYHGEYVIEVGDEARATWVVSPGPNQYRLRRTVAGSLEVTR